MFRTRPHKPKTHTHRRCQSLGRVRLFATPGTVACWAPLSMGLSKPERWSGGPFPSPGDLPDPGVEPESLALQAGSLPPEPPGQPEMDKRGTEARVRGDSQPSPLSAAPSTRGLASCRRGTGQGRGASVQASSRSSEPPPPTCLSFPRDRCPPSQMYGGLHVGSVGPVLSWWPREGLVRTSQPSSWLSDPAHGHERT